MEARNLCMSVVLQVMHCVSLLLVLVLILLFVLAGTGKTATVIAVITALQKQAESGVIPAFHFVEINCLRLKNPTDACEPCHPILILFYFTYCNNPQTLNCGEASVEITNPLSKH